MEKQILLDMIDKLSKSQIIKLTEIIKKDFYICYCSTNIECKNKLEINECIGTVYCGYRRYKYIN